MKSSYEERGAKFAKVLGKLFADCVTLRDYQRKIREYNCTHSRKIEYRRGVSRLVILRADYVIKFEYKNDDFDGNAGNNYTEAMVYQRALLDGFAYLLAEPTLLMLGHKCVSVMPRIKHVDRDDYYDHTYFSDEEAEWLYNNVYDLHPGNVGFIGKRPVIIDYAWDAHLDDEDDSSDGFDSKW